MSTDRKRKPGGGRKPLPIGEKRRSVSVGMKQGVYTKLERLARKLKRTTYSVGGEIIDQYFEDKEE